jgi:thiamine pyrophosphate-dependent acetolactate synthase large subunit-like protein
MTMMVLNNGDLNMVSWEQRITEGDAKLPASQDLPSFPYAAYAELLGLRGIRVDSPDQAGRPLRARLAARRSGCAGHRHRDHQGSVGRPIPREEQKLK